MRITKAMLQEQIERQNLWLEVMQVLAIGTPPDKDVLVSPRRFRVFGPLLLITDTVSQPEHPFVNVARLDSYLDSLRSIRGLHQDGVRPIIQELETK